MSFYHRNLPIHGVQFHPRTSPFKFRPALRTAPVGVGVLVVSYEKGALIMPGRF